MKAFPVLLTILVYFTTTAFCRDGIIKNRRDELDESVEFISKNSEVERISSPDDLQGIKNLSHPKKFRRSNHRHASSESKLIKSLNELDVKSISEGNSIKGNVDNKRKVRRRYNNGQVSTNSSNGVRPRLMIGNLINDAVDQGTNLMGAIAKSQINLVSGGLDAMIKHYTVGVADFMFEHFPLLSYVKVPIEFIMAFFAKIWQYAKKPIDYVKDLFD